MALFFFIYHFSTGRILDKLIRTYADWIGLQLYIIYGEPGIKEYKMGG